jgi:predicted SAM-dependent methyltransferase
MDSIEFRGKQYPRFQSLGNASQFAIPFAIHVCKGKGYDIGFGKDEWKLPNAIGIDRNLHNSYHADSLPDEQVDYIYSSHCLEHVDDWVTTLQYWISKLKVGGVLFLYLPDFSQTYWRPWHNSKHKHCFTSEIVYECLVDLGMKNIFRSGIDLNNSFMIMCEKSE